MQIVYVICPQNATMQPVCVAERNQTVAKLTQAKFMHVDITRPHLCVLVVRLTDLREKNSLQELVQLH